jgi:hypothetical protein
VPEDPPDLAHRIDRYAGRFGLATLAPVFDRLADRLDRGAALPEAGPIFPARPGPTPVPPHPSTRKMLAFDVKLRTYVGSAVGCFILMMLKLLLGFFRGVGWGTVFHSGVMLLLMPWLLRRAVARLRELRRVIPRCTVVPARLGIKQRLPSRSGTKLIVSILYTLGETQREVVMEYPWGLWDLVSLSPDLLVDPESPEQPLIRDYYI